MMVVMRMFEYQLFIVCIIGFSNLSSATLNFNCPNSVPKNFPPPSKDVNNLKDQFRNACKDGTCTLNGVSANLDPSIFESQGEYAQYQAARALVPCDETPIGVFIPSTQVGSQNSPVDKHSVAITYSTAPVTDELKQWLEDALQGCGYGNAVQKALEEKGVKADHHLDGDDILDVLCPKPTPPPPPPAPCSGGSIEETRECCSVQNPCTEGAGDCDDDDECEGDLICGKNNCGHSFTWASADCCKKKDKNDDVTEEQKIEADNTIYYSSYGQPNQPASTTREEITTTATEEPETTTATEEPETTTEEANENYGSEELPTGWEKQYDAPSGRFYYVDHINLRTQWENPSLGYAPPPAIGARAKRDTNPPEPSFVTLFMTFMGNLLPSKQNFKRDSLHYLQTAPTPSPIYYKPLPSDFKPEPAYHEPQPVHHPAPVYHSPEPVHNQQTVYHEPKPVHTSEPTYQASKPVQEPKPVYHQPNPAYHQPSYKAVDCYNPPEPKFIIRIRTIRDETCCKEGSAKILGVCQELTEECKEMMEKEETIIGSDGQEQKIKRMVSCSQPRLTDLNGECADQAGYTDCVEEDEEYLSETNFYSSCENDEECFTNRRRPIDNNNPLDKNDSRTQFYPGYKEAKQCEARKKRSPFDELLIRPKRDSSYSASYPKHEPLFIKQVGQCRVIQAKGGDVHKRCDRIAETKPLDYKTAVTLFPPGADLLNDASDFDLLEL